MVSRSEYFVPHSGEDGVTLSVVAKLVKWAYCYRQWDFFDCWLPRVLAALSVIISVFCSIVLNYK
jgi:hypothetical protein